MRDPRIAHVADILVNYSTRLQPGEEVLIEGSTAAEPMLLEIYRAALRAGAHPLLLVQPAEAREIFLREANDDQLGSSRRSWKRCSNGSIAGSHCGPRKTPRP